MIITKTPFRLSFFGGGTDYNRWFEQNGGLVIGSAFTRYCYISVRNLPPFFDHKSRIVYSKVEEVINHRDILHPSVRACLRELQIEQGVEIHHDGDLPARSGIGSSSSFTVGLLLALHALKARMVTKQELAKQAIDIEQNILRETVGIQDQVLSAYGGIQKIELGPGDRMAISPLILPKDYRANFESHILLGFTGMQRYSSEIAESTLTSIRATDKYDQLEEILEIAKEGLHAFTKNSDMNEIGRLIDKTWQIKRKLSNSISSPIIDELYTAAIKAGAFGGRLMGAGGGGFIFFIAPPETHNAIKEALVNSIKVWVPFSFDHEGSRILLSSQDESFA